MFKLYDMKTILKLSVFAFMMFAVSFNADAQKFGYMNSTVLLAEMPEVKQADANLEVLKKQLTKRGQEMLQSLQTKYQDLAKKEQQGELSPKQTEVEAQKLREEEAKIVEYEKDMQQQLITKRETLLAPIVEKVNQAIQEVAKENGFNYIFDARQDFGILLYADESTDVTSLVKSKLGI